MVLLSTLQLMMEKHLHSWLQAVSGFLYRINPNGDYLDQTPSHAGLMVLMPMDVLLDIKRVDGRGIMSVVAIFPIVVRLDQTISQRG